MRELTMEETRFVSGGGNLDRDSGYSKGQLSGGTRSSATAKGVGKGADGGAIMDHTLEAAKNPGNNPGFWNSWTGKTLTAVGNAFKTNGTPDFSQYNAMGDYSGRSSENTSRATGLRTSDRSYNRPH
ncbi:hypothetical protein AB4Y96_11235 [Phyllobacterium sp. TAF24]|uniref:hypothetical protein n=1 Tax=Phyllobacterium sp. TAF24 TaxID=3233068 RepID=UPI003F9CA8A4